MATMLEKFRTFAYDGYKFFDVQVYIKDEKCFITVSKDFSTIINSSVNDSPNAIKAIAPKGTRNGFYTVKLVPSKQSLEFRIFSPKPYKPEPVKFVESVIMPKIGIFSITYSYQPRFEVDVITATKTFINASECRVFAARNKFIVKNPQIKSELEKIKQILDK